MTASRKILKIGLKNPKAGSIINVHEDFKRAFGEAPGTVTAIGIMTDTDNTGENIHAYYGDIQFRRIAPSRVTFTSD